MNPLDSHCQFPKIRVVLDYFALSFAKMDTIYNEYLIVLRLDIYFCFTLSIGMLFLYGCQYTETAETEHSSLRLTSRIQYTRFFQ